MRWLPTLFVFWNTRFSINTSGEYPQSTEDRPQLVRAERLVRNDLGARIDIRARVVIRDRGGAATGDVEEDAVGAVNDLEIGHPLTRHGRAQVDDIHVAVDCRVLGHGPLECAAHEHGTQVRLLHAPSEF